MGSGGKDEKMEDATTGRKGGEEVGGGGGADGKLKEKEVGLFSEGDKVLAYHGPLIYEAKIQRAEFRKKEWKYFVHYLGWSKNWDEWVGTDRLMALTDTNLEMQKKLFKTQNVDKQSKGRVPQGRQKAPTDSKGEKEGAKINTASLSAVPKGKKRKADAVVSEEKDSDEPDPVMKIPVPAILKKQLVDDWELIQSGKLIKLPRSPNVEEILKKYREFKAKRDSLEGDSLGEVLKGLQSYFNKALPAMLLYKQERVQYGAAVQDGLKPSLVYGAEHLLRLFVKLPELLVYTNMEEETLTQLQQKLMDFLKFLQKHQSSFFLSMYDGTKSGARAEPEEKKLKRDNIRVSDDKKDRRDVVKAIEDKREKRVGPKIVEDKREKKDASRSEDRKERKETPQAAAEDKRDKKEQRPSEEKREKKEGPKATEEKEKGDSSRSLEDRKEKKDESKPSDDKKEKKDNFKSSNEAKEKRDNSKSSDDKKDKRESSKSLDDKKDKRSTSKFVDEKKEKKKNPKISDDKNERRDSSKSLDDKKEKKDSSRSLDDKKEKKDGSRSLDDKKDKRDSSKPLEDQKEKVEDGSIEHI